jgi:hypothetical protein
MPQFTLSFDPRNLRAVAAYAKERIPNGLASTSLEEIEFSLRKSSVGMFVDFFKSYPLEPRSLIRTVLHIPVVRATSATFTETDHPMSVFEKFEFAPMSGDNPPAPHYNCGLLVFLSDRTIPLV